MKLKTGGMQELPVQHGHSCEQYMCSTVNVLLVREHQQFLIEDCVLLL